MKQKPSGRPSSSEQTIRDIKRKTRKQHSAEEKIRIVLDSLRGEDSIAELCRREAIAQSLYYKWSKDFMEAGKKRRKRCDNGTILLTWPRLPGHPASALLRSESDQGTSSHPPARLSSTIANIRVIKVSSVIDSAELGAATPHRPYGFNE